MPTDEFSIPADVGFSNALRRTLLSDISTDAPKSIFVECNETCHADEFLAHRIGLIPFRRTGPGQTAVLEATGPCCVRARDIRGAFESVHPDIEVLRLADTHRVHVRITFDRQKAHVHARYSPCYAVGMRIAGPKQCVLSFGCNDDRTPHACLLEALDCMDARIDSALLQLSNDAPPPKSYV